MLGFVLPEVIIEFQGSFGEGFERLGFAGLREKEFETIREPSV